MTSIEQTPKTLPLSPAPHSELTLSSPFVTLKFAARNIERKDTGNNHADCYFLLKAQGNVAYKSEIIKNQKHPSWDSFQLNLSQLGSAAPASPKLGQSPKSPTSPSAVVGPVDLDQEVSVEVWDWDRFTTHDFIGCINVPLRKLLIPATEFPIINPEKEKMARSLNYVHSGILTVEAVVFREDAAVSTSDLSRGGSLRLI